MDKIWLQNYPPGVPAEINPAEYRSLLDMVEQSLAQFRDRPGFTCMDRTLTYGDLDRLAAQFAAYLQQVAGLRKGDRIAIMLPNLLQYPVAILGAFRAGPHRRQHQPDVHAARAAAPAARLGRARDPDPRELRAHAAGSASTT